MADTAPPVRLYCFAHAGAGVSAFRRWAHSTGPGVEPVPVLLPGREGRRREPRLTDREALVADLLERVRAEDGRPFVMYGHSLGALVVHTLVRAMQETGRPLPALVAVGACPPPDEASELSDACESFDEELMDLLRTLGASPEGTVPDGYWRRAVLPVLRDDLRLAHALRAAARGAAAAHGPLPVPLLAVSGDRDPLAPRATVAGWRRWSAGPVVTRTVPGDHFFVRGTALPRLLGRACRVVQRSGSGQETREPALIPGARR
ncbi:thioesterase [Streptomyces piniterrae]|uniref:Thioesterase n=1 Tax=Streptomyces piniterrae TaxID=2571125 RepID=A0A4U0NDP3_9ACTN|nr:alpha/beta fold hydrolase [Streptomyces piniterrae]TJZ52116.1 thioesterase [Streptomyces piniterrae]